MPVAAGLLVQVVVREEAAEPKEARNTPFCLSQEKFHTVVLRGLRNMSEAP